MDYNSFVKSLRILSLLPAATEMVYLLGLEDSLVGVSHECDYPPQVKLKPQVTTSLVSNAMSSKEIDKKVKKVGHRDPGVFHIKEEILGKLRPNLILTQELCEVCAIGFTEVRKAARVLAGDVKIVSLEPESVDDILENIRVVGEVGGKKKEAVRVIRGLKKRLEKVEKRLLRSARNDVGRPKVCVVEWLDPIMVAGHWVPEMVNIAGGVNLLTKPGERSKYININQIVESKPDILIISPCGFDIKRTIKEEKLIERIVSKIRVVSDVRVELLDGNAYMTRPGPRIIDGIEQLYAMIKKYANS